MKVHERGPWDVGQRAPATERKRKRKEEKKDGERKGREQGRGERKGGRKEERKGDQRVRKTCGSTSCFTSPG